MSCSNKNIFLHEETSKNLTKKIKNLQKDFKKTRLKRIRNEINDDDNDILKLQKKLKIKENKITQGFINDGLDGILEACDKVADKKRDKKKSEKSNVKKNKSVQRSKVMKISDGVYEDLYGRICDENGNLLEAGGDSQNIGNNSGQTDGETEAEKQLKVQLNGLINKLEETNMASISKKVKILYEDHTQNEMNRTLIEIFNKNLIVQTLLMKEFIAKRVLFIAILHASIGYEIGAQFLENFVVQFWNRSRSNEDVENKEVNNLVQVLSDMYNFNIYENVLLYNILYELVNSFKENDIECILIILATCGFRLRKDDPSALKSFIVKLQERVASFDMNTIDLKIKFLLETVAAVKNNNFSKIPSFDESYNDRLKKILLSCIPKGTSLFKLSVTLNTLLKVENRGRWWTVGFTCAEDSATNTTKTETKSESKAENNDNDNDDSSNMELLTSFSKNLLERARQEHMVTNVRKTIFCILMTAEDDWDAFEKILKLNLKNVQKREIINVIVHCSLRENPFNPYYVVLVDRFCNHHRTFKVALRFTVGDKIKALDSFSIHEHDNLVNLITNLLLKNCLSITILKVIEFSEIDETSLNFTRKLLINVLVHNNDSECYDVFKKLQSREFEEDHKLKMFRISLRLFIQHLLLKDTDDSSLNLNDKQLKLIRNRIEIIISSL